MSGDEVMTEAFLKGEDIHKRTAAKVFGVDENEVTHEQRAAAKTVNFSIVYGVSDFGLSTDLGISFREASDLIKSYGEQFPKITSYLDGLKKKGEEEGEVSTLYGRKRILSELKSPNRNVRNFGLRAAMNTPVQGTAADIIKLANDAMDDNKTAIEVADAVYDYLYENSKGDIVTSIALKQCMPGDVMLLLRQAIFSILK